MMTVTQAAMKYQVSPEAIYRAIRLKQLVANRDNGKINLQAKEVEKWLRRK